MATTEAQSARAPQAAPRSNVLGAVGWMVGALVSFSLVAIAGRQAQQGMSTVEIMFWRGVLGVVLLSALLIALRGRLADLASPQPVLHVGRAIVHFGAQFSWLFALTLIPMVSSTESSLRSSKFQSR